MKKENTLERVNMVRHIAPVLRRRFFGLHIPDEIFAVFFLLVLISLAKDKSVVEKVKTNGQIQIAIVLLMLYCLYNRIPWSLAFLLAFSIALLFGNLFFDMWDNFGTLIEKKEEETKKDSGLLEMGARIMGWVAKSKKEEKEKKKEQKKKPKGILKKKKVRFENKNPKEEEEDSEMCKKVSAMFGLSDVSDSEAETDVDMGDDLDDFVASLPEGGKKEK